MQIGNKAHATFRMCWSIAICLKAEVFPTQQGLTKLPSRLTGREPNRWNQGLSSTLVWRKCQVSTARSWERRHGHHFRKMRLQDLLLHGNGYGSFLESTWSKGMSSWTILVCEFRILFCLVLTVRAKLKLLTFFFFTTPRMPWRALSWGQAWCSGLSSLTMATQWTAKFFWL